MSLKEQAERVYDIAMQDGRRIIGVTMIESALNKSQSRARGRARGSRNRKGLEPVYRMVIADDRVFCSCPSFQHRAGACKHLGLLAARLLVKLRYL